MATDALERMTVRSDVADQVVRVGVSSAVISLLPTRPTLLIDRTGVPQDVTVVLPGNPGGALAGREFVVKRTDAIEEANIVIVKVDGAKIGGHDWVKIQTGGASVTFVATPRSPLMGASHYEVVATFVPAGVANPTKAIVYV